MGKKNISEPMIYQTHYRRSHLIFIILSITHTYNEQHSNSLKKVKFLLARDHKTAWISNPGSLAPEEVLISTVKTQATPIPHAQ